MKSVDMLLTAVILIVYISDVAQSAAGCKVGDKKTSITVETEFRQLPLLKSYSNVKLITSNKSFKSRYDEYSTARENYDSMDTSAEVSGSYGAFSASVSASYSSVTSSASSMSEASGTTTSGEEYKETENTEQREYQDGYFQIMRDIKTTVTINGKSASVEEQQIVNARPTNNQMTMDELKQLAKDYISERYGDVKEGKISGGGVIFSQSQCYAAAPKPTTPKGELKNVSLKKPTTQSSTAAAGSSDRAVDGNTNPNYHGGKSCTHTNGAGWWKVHLLQEYKINKILIYNRADPCCRGRINGVKVFAGDRLCGTISYKAGQIPYEIECDGATASIVKIENPKTSLTLCEVQVIGRPAALDGQC